ncbi:hypothetical protein Tco_0712331, partial [Tanacetum coccineum]
EAYHTKNQQRQFRKRTVQHIMDYPAKLRPVDPFEFALVEWDLLGFLYKLLAC